MSEKNRQAGRKGGLATKAKYGIEHYRELGKAGGRLGGRPRNKSIEELQTERQQAVSEAINIKKGAGRPTLKELKRLFYLRYGEK